MLFNLEPGAIYDYFFPLKGLTADINHINNTNMNVLGAITSTVDEESPQYK